MMDVTMRVAARIDLVYLGTRVDGLLDGRHCFTTILRARNYWEILERRGPHWRSLGGARTQQEAVRFIWTELAVTASLLEEEKA